MKKIIVLKATQHRGKSSTLLELIKKIKVNESCSTLVDEPYYNTDDKFLVATNGFQRIAVITEGDAITYEQIEASLRRCKILGVDVIFCASWTHGNVFNLICKFSEQNGYRLIETTPTYSYSQDDTLVSRLNDRMAQMLLTLIPI